MESFEVSQNCFEVRGVFLRGAFFRGVPALPPAQPQQLIEIENQFQLAGGHDYEIEIEFHFQRWVGGSAPPFFTLIKTNHQQNVSTSH
jgi:hypothetical protein